MAIQTEPTRIQIPFADSGTKNVIPDTNSTPSASQAASWTEGFPAQCSLPLSAGGIPPARADFNGIFNSITQGLRFTQEGGVYTWDATVDYAADRMVLGSDGNLYWSVAQSGPNVGGAQDPTTDTTHVYWNRLSTIDDSGLVHIAGQETITGIKTIGNRYVFSNGDAGSELVVATPDFEIGAASLASAIEYASIQFADIHGFDPNNGHNGIAVIDAVPPSQGSDESQFNLLLRPFSANGAQYGRVAFQLRSLPDGPGFVDISSNAMVHGSHPMIACRMDGAPAKGTFPTGNTYSSFYFTDSDVANAFGSSDSPKHRYAETGYRTRANGDSQLFFAAFKNETGSTSFTQIFFAWNTNNIKGLYPADNGDVNLGFTNNRWKEVWCSQSSLNSTSDERIKNSIDSIPENILDVWGNINWIQFKYNDAVDEKGESARLHTGLIAQDIDRTFKASGLDVSRYGFFCYDKWDAEPDDYDENGNLRSKGHSAGDLYSLRYVECLCIEAAYQRRRAERAEARLVALEEKLAALEEKLQ